MRLNGKHVLDVAAEDIQQLLANEVQESRMLDYKMELGDDNKELLADITSFANTDGGVIIYGIQERKEDGKNTGIPDRVVGLGEVNTDIIRQRIENILRDNVDPRLPNVLTHFVSVSGHTVLVLGVPRSLLAPHMVKKDSKFYSRNSISKFPMDAQQIRQAMLQSDDWEKQAENLRRVRVMDLQAGRNMYLRSPQRFVALHVVPLGQSKTVLDFRNSKQELKLAFKPYGYSGWDGTFNLDGFLVWPGSPGESYTQLFRNGALEVITTAIFTQNGQGNLTLDSTELEKHVVRTTTTYLRQSKKLDIIPPFGLFLTIVGAQCLITGTRPSEFVPQVLQTTSGRLSYPEILLPGIVIEDADVELPTLFKGTFDMLWQAAGTDGSPHFRTDGSWILSIS